MFDIAINNGIVVSGAGNPWFKANIGVSDGKIAIISRLSIAGAERTIDAKGLIVAPGFIDSHTHSDSTVLGNPRCENHVRQGVTTNVTGMCGTGDYKVEEFRNAVERQGAALNIAHTVGMNKIRAHVYGREKSRWELIMPTADELDKLKKMVSQAMEEGAFGISSSMWNMYPEEILELCKVVAGYGGCFDLHSRGNDGQTLIEGLKEGLWVAEKTGVPFNYSHLYARHPENWGKAVEAIRLITEARNRGIEATCDVYPTLLCMPSSPIALFECRGGTMSGRVHSHQMTDKTFEQMMDDMRNDETYEEMKRDLDECLEKEQKLIQEKRKKLPLLAASAVPDARNLRTQYVVAHSSSHPEFDGKYINEISVVLDIEDPLDALRKVVLDDEGSTLGASGAMREEDLIAVLKAPFTSIGSDSSVMDQPPPPEKLTSPRTYGSFSIVLDRYVRQLRIFSLEEAVRKMTSLVANRLGLKDRGVLREGNWADMVVFNPKTIKNNATWENPCRYPDGIPYVIINGQMVIDESEHTGALPGRVLKHHA